MVLDRVVQPTTSRRTALKGAAVGLVGTLFAGAAGAGSPVSVFVRPANGQSDAIAAVRDHGGTVTHAYDNFSFIAAKIPSDNRDDLAADNRVEGLEDDGTIEALHHKDGHEGGPPGDGGGDDGGGSSCDHPTEQLWWGVDRIDADVAHSNGYTGGSADNDDKDESGDDETDSDVDIAILDTGIDKDHCDLEENVEGGHNCTNGPERKWNDKNGHGSHCAGIAAAVNDSDDIGVVGVAPDANLYGVKVLKNGGLGSWSDAVCGIDWCISNEIPILSMSFGADSAPSTVRDAVERAYDAGHVLVAAAGNSGNNGSSGGCENSNVGYPAAYEEVIAVSSLEKDDDIAEFSSVGPEVELIAPGGGDADENGSIENSEAIYSTYKDNGYDYLNGTSMACPHVSGVAGLVWHAEGYSLDGTDDIGSIGSNGADDDPSSFLEGGENNDELRQTLRETAEDVGLDPCESGAGLVDAAAALGLDSSDST